MTRKLLLYLLGCVCVVLAGFRFGYGDVARERLRASRDRARIEHLDYLAEVLGGISTCADGRPFYGSEEQLAVGRSFEDGQRLDDGWLKIKKECLASAAPRLSVLLMDPLDNEDYHFQFISDGKNFLLRARLESAASEVAFYEVGTSLSTFYVTLNRLR